MGRRRRQQDVKSRWGAAIGVLGTTLFAHPARGADLWAPAAWFPQTAEDASLSWGIAARGGWEDGLVPPFRAAERDRFSMGAEGFAALGRVQIRGGWSWLRDASVAGAPMGGPGDVRLGTAVAVARVAPPGAGTLRLWAGWEAKLPNAADEGELGTDETDALFGGTVAWEGGGWDARVGVGLGILGNPHRFANQDDVPLVRARVERAVGPVRLAPWLKADLATSRNPARVQVGGEALAGGPVFVVLGGAAGLTPAAADWSVTAGLGWRPALPDGPAAE